MDLSACPDAFARFECEAPHRFAYETALLAQSLRVLGSATETRVKVNAEGLMLLQHRVRDKADHFSYVSFYMLADAVDGELDGEVA